MTGNISQVDNREGGESIGQDGGAEQEEHSLLETTPLTQKRRGVIIILHRDLTEPSPLPFTLSVLQTTRSTPALTPT